jgi:hypothetical protein
MELADSLAVLGHASWWNDGLDLGVLVWTLLLLE